MVNIINNKELQWFIWLVDTEGSFYTTKKKDSQIFDITMSRRDLNLLFYIQNLLGMGYVYEDIKNNKAHYKITNKK